MAEVSDETCVVKSKLKRIVSFLKRKIYGRYLYVKFNRRHNIAGEC